MKEYCHRCQCVAPSWESPTYAEWHEVISPQGEYLGVLCVGCLAGEDLALLELGSIEVEFVAGYAEIRRAA
jgi:hypothetical protein